MDSNTQPYGMEIMGPESQAATQNGSLEALKGFVAQFAVLLPEEKRNAILHTIAQLEEAGGIQSEAQGQRILQELMCNLGMNTKC